MGARPGLLPRSLAVGRSRRLRSDPPAREQDLARPRGPRRESRSRTRRGRRGGETETHSHQQCGAETYPTDGLSPLAPLAQMGVDGFGRGAIADRATRLQIGDVPVAEVADSGTPRTDVLVRERAGKLGDLAGETGRRGRGSGRTWSFRAQRGEELTAARLGGIRVPPPGEQRSDLDAVRPGGTRRGSPLGSRGAAGEPERQPERPGLRRIGCVPRAADGLSTGGQPSWPPRRRVAFSSDPPGPRPGHRPFGLVPRRRPGWSSGASSV